LEGTFTLLFLFLLRTRFFVITPRRFWFWTSVCQGESCQASYINGQKWIWSLC